MMTYEELKDKITEAMRDEDVESVMAMITFENARIVNDNSIDVAYFARAIEGLRSLDDALSEATDAELLQLIKTNYANIDAFGIT